jgi:ABC-type glycerol-3-phosphate transport system permease component
MLLSSFKNSTEIFHYPPTFFPETWHFDNYPKLFQDRPFGLWYRNSIIVGVIQTAAVLFFSSLAGFGFAKYRFKGRNLMFATLLGSTMIPFALILIPLFIEVSHMHLTDSYRGLILPFMAPAFGIFVMKQFTENIPDELLDAARIDGASEFRIFMTIVLPMSVPGLTTLAIFTFFGEWNSFLWPYIVNTDKKYHVIASGLFVLSQTEAAANFGLLYAAYITSSIPLLILFI